MRGPAYGPSPQVKPGVAPTVHGCSKIEIGLS
jgi:hypothetical protein